MPDPSLRWQQFGDDRHLVILTGNSTHEVLCAFRGHSVDPSLPCAMCFEKIFDVHRSALAENQ